MRRRPNDTGYRRCRKPRSRCRCEPWRQISVEISSHACRVEALDDARVDTIGSQLLDVGFGAEGIPVMTEGVFGTGLLIESPLIDGAIRCEEFRSEERLENKPSAEVDTTEKRRGRCLYYESAIRR